MTTLTQVRDSLALTGRANAFQLSRQLKAPQPLIQAMLEQLVAMRKAEVVEVNDGRLSGICKNCVEGKKCLKTSYSLIR